MNGKYIFKMLLEAMAGFNDYMLKKAVDYSDLTRSKKEREILT